MAAVVLVGAQWGDEGKGKITDYLAEKAEVVVRYQGGSNAGHTVMVGEQEFKLHLVPSGILYPGKLCLIGNGVVVDPAVLVQELDGLAERGIDTSSLRISDRAHLILPYHKGLDAVEEERRGQAQIGTTKRGIGPAYVDKTARTGIRVGDLLDWEEFRGKLARNLAAVNEMLAKIYDRPGYDLEAILDEYAGYARRLRPLIADTVRLVNGALKDGRRVLFEGAQGTLLDLDQGTYPFVTSSYPTAGGACIGAGIGPTKINKVLGVAKAYTTRVGAGPFPAEVTGRIGDTLREQGREYGTTTGRPRRCGWLDTVILRHAAEVNGLTGIALTKLDVLTGIDPLRICTGYRYGGEIIRDFPASLKVLQQCEPVYEEVPGWQEDITAARSLADLPAACRSYIRRLEELTGVPVHLIAVGPRRDQTIVVEDVF
ncbi:MAG: adenylosuccinate synthase [Moorella sp. (in: firmicutes)]|jgi:adenylosuccinate synthase|uniref:adenylosuccinate synthase n=1 Tax=Moorella sp. E306M TaxID=2572683 RepID=UPI0010FFC1D6|nr:adenylosuccinate synthase [Moorella sp. E306M]MDK2817133.1 adenylosuccinate synthase [Moorella sp. (in: firmicutes)]MDK2894977.1 adenylosuccinate synthase [Moorella sp. (in: firmicutes)]GEA18380.1 adenylosuccinate synthetase [Moorella sp. E306M]